jgi:hypothetical protein
LVEGQGAEVEVPPAAAKLGRAAFIAAAKLGGVALAAAAKLGGVAVVAAAKLGGVALVAAGAVPLGRAASVVAEPLSAKVAGPLVRNGRNAGTFLCLSASTVREKVSSSSRSLIVFALGASAELKPTPGVRSRANFWGSFLEAPDKPWYFVTCMVNSAPKFLAAISMLIGQTSRRTVERLRAAAEAGSGSRRSEVRPRPSSVEKKVSTCSCIASRGCIAVHGTIVSKTA